MNTIENLSTLKINKLTKAQYQRELDAGNIKENELYLTPDEEIDFSPYATKIDVEDTYQTKKDANDYKTGMQTTIDEFNQKLTNITNNMVDTADIVDNLSTNSADKVLSANQGVAIKALIEGHTDVNNAAHIVVTDELNERQNWNTAYTHSQEDHAPADAEKNQNAFSHIKLPAGSWSADYMLSAKSDEDTISIEGENVSISATGGYYNYGQGGNWGNGNETTEKKLTFTVADGTTSTKGVVQLTDSVESTSTTTAATPNAVKAAYDLADGKQDPIIGAASTIIDTDLTASKVLVSNADGKVAASSITTTELNTLSGIEDNVQNQFNVIYEDIDTNITPVLNESIKTLTVETKSAGNESTGSVVTYTKNDGTSETITIDDTNVKQMLSNANGYRALLMGYSHKTLDNITGLDADEYGNVYKNSSIAASPSKGDIRATTFTGNLIGNADTATTATTATNADVATKATQDGNGKVIANTYETKTDATTQYDTINSAISKMLKIDGWNGEIAEEADMDYYRPGLDSNDNRTGTYISGSKTKTETLKNIPDGLSTGFKLFVIGGYVNSRVDQFITTNSNAIYHRKYNGSSWSTWERFYTSANPPKLSDLGVSASAEELNYVDGVTSSIQTQLDEKVPATRTVNGKALSEDIALAASDIGASEAGHTHDGYMTTDNPICSGSFVMNKISIGTTGEHSVLMGYGGESSGDCSIAMGYTDKSTGSSSVAMGYNCEATSSYSTAIGCNCKATNIATAAIGYYCEASGIYSTAMGNNTVSNSYQHIQGHYNNKNNATAGNSSGTTGTAFVIGNGTSSEASNACRITYAGGVIGKTAYSTSGADYAEYFEWADGNVENEERVGYFVTFEDGKFIKKANEGDYILGIVSGNPSVLGNHDECWMGRNEMDEWGRFIYVTETETDEVTGEVHEYQTYKVNPDYDDSIQYIPRSDRPEWDAIGMLGLLSVRDDGTCKVNGYCKVADGGIATASDIGYRVVERVSDNIVRVIFR